MDHAKDVDALEQRIKELCYAKRHRDATSILRELLDRLREVTLPDEKRIMRMLHMLGPAYSDGTDLACSYSKQIL